jgi:hypothetical protein
VEFELDAEPGLVVLLEALVEDGELTTKVKDPVYARLLASPWYVP